MKYVFEATAEVKKDFIIEAENDDEAQAKFDELAIQGIYFNEIKKSSLKATFYPKVDHMVEVKSAWKLTHPSRFGLLNTPIDFEKN